MAAPGMQLNPGRARLPAVVTRPPPTRHEKDSTPGLAAELRAMGLM